MLLHTTITYRSHRVVLRQCVYGHKINGKGFYGRLRLGFMVFCVIYRKLRVLLVKLSSFRAQ